MIDLIACDRMDFALGNDFNQVSKGLDVAGVGVVRLLFRLIGLIVDLTGFR